MSGWFSFIPRLIEPPSDLPDAKMLLVFDVDSKKSEIFEAARDRIKSKAQLGELYINKCILILYIMISVYIIYYLLYTSLLNAHT